MVACALAAVMTAAACADDPGGGAAPEADASAEAATAEAGQDAGPAPPSPRVALPTALAVGLSEPRGVALVGDTLYVAEYGAGRVVAVPRAGGPLRVVASGLGGPNRVAVAGNALVVTEREGGRVLWIDLGGAVMPIVADAVRPGEVAVAGGEVLWLDEGVDAGTGALRAASLDGGTPRVLAGGVTRAHGLAVSSAEALFTADAVGDAKGSVFSVSSGAGAGAEAGAGGVVVVAATTEQARGIAVDGQAGVVYWASRKATGAGASEGFIRRASVDGGSPSRFSDAPYGADRVALRGKHLYFTNYQALVRVPLAGGAREDLAVHTSVGGLVATDDAVYWTDPEAGKLYAK